MMEKHGNSRTLLKKPPKIYDKTMVSTSFFVRQNQNLRLLPLKSGLRLTKSRIFGAKSINDLSDIVFVDAFVSRFNLY